MRHFSLDQWIDFARNVLGPGERAEMESHLSEGCKRCSKTLSLWQRVHQVGRRESGYAPPETMVSTIKGMYAIHGPRKATRAGRAIAKLLFDSAKAPLQAGVRSSAATERQLLYGVSKYRIDVRIDAQPNSDKVALVGQVLDSAMPGQSIGAVPVTLCRGNRVLAEATTSPFGEFYLECDLGKSFQLRIKLPKEELCLPLAEPTIELTKGSSEAYDLKRVSSLFVRGRKRTRKKV
jgi:hypothetical protein